MGRPILNYTTSIPVEKTVAEIQRALSQHDGIQILTSYSGGILSSISFRLSTKHGMLSFLLPAKIDNVLMVLECSKVSAKLKTKEQAARVAWRIIKNWIEAQMALVQADQVTIEEVFCHSCRTTRERRCIQRYRKKASLD